MYGEDSSTSGHDYPSKREDEAYCERDSAVYRGPRKKETARGTEKKQRGKRAFLFTRNLQGGTKRAPMKISEEGKDPSLQLPRPRKKKKKKIRQGVRREGERSRMRSSGNICSRRKGKWGEGSGYISVPFGNTPTEAFRKKTEGKSEYRALCFLREALRGEESPLKTEGV